MKIIMRNVLQYVENRVNGDVRIRYDKITDEMTLYIDLDNTHNFKYTVTNVLQKLIDGKLSTVFCGKDIIRCYRQWVELKYFK